MKMTIWAWLLLLPLWGWSQDQGPRLRIAYLGGQITHPGITLGIDQVLFSKDQERSNGATVRKEWRYGLDLGVYYHQDLHTGIFITPQLEWLRTGNRGGQWGFGLAAGYLRTFIPRVYEVDDAGNVSKRSLAGTDHGILMPHLRFGKDLSWKKKLPLEWYLQTNLMLQYPYFGGVNKYFLLEAGLNYHLKK